MENNNFSSNFNDIPKWKIILFFLAISLPGVLFLIPMLKSFILTKASLNPELKLVSFTKIATAIFVQTYFFIGLASTLGVFLAPKVGLKLGFFEDGKIFNANLKPIVSWALCCASLFYVGIHFAPGGPLPSITESSLTEILKQIPVKIFYGGIVEEIILRLGIMTVLVWLGELMSGRSFANYFCAIATSSILFGIGHLPAYFSLVGDNYSMIVVGKIIFLNSVGGIIYGYLYWQKGLLSAMICYALTHVFMTMFLLLKLLV